MNISARDLIRLVVSSENMFLFINRETANLQSVGTYSLLHEVCLPRVVLCTAIISISIGVQPFA